ncbi:hypothetical protein VNO78_05445 [Psophocarpus tetragonolobus]|uniref:Pectinesterase catalytic domain-containing protein n=1 Tax=Psophocarpus tetragonolobus TaxID=3891 RepID=A0AAN9T0N7_PSOTE
MTASNKKLLSDDEIPSWVSERQRRLLQAADPKPNVVVAQDGSRQVKTNHEALMMVSKKNKQPFVIYIRECVSREHRSTRHVGEEEI